jgi:hypothetical protein
MATVCPVGESVRRRTYSGDGMNEEGVAIEEWAAAPTDRNRSSLIAPSDVGRGEATRARPGPEDIHGGGRES